MADYIEIHVDETGDCGFSSKSSPYFCLAACAFRHSRRRRIEAYGIKSVEPGWHLTQPWWDRVTAAVPGGGTSRGGRGAGPPEVSLLAECSGSPAQAVDSAPPVADQCTPRGTTTHD